MSYEASARVPNAPSQSYWGALSAIERGNRHLKPASRSLPTAQEAALETSIPKRSIAMAIRSDPKCPGSELQAADGEGVGAYGSKPFRAPTPRPSHTAPHGQLLRIGPGSSPRRCGGDGGRSKRCARPPASSGWCGSGGWSPGPPEWLRRSRRGGGDPPAPPPWPDRDDVLIFPLVAGLRRLRLSPRCRDLATILRQTGMYCSNPETALEE